MKKTLLIYLLLGSVFLCLAGLAFIAFGGGFRLWGMGGLLAGILGTLTYIVLNYSEVQSFLFAYRTRQWFSLVLFVVLLLGVVIMIQAIANRHNIRFDMTPRKDMSLSAASKRIMEDIRTPIHVTAFYQRNQKREMMNILDPFALVSRHFTYTLYDPDRNPALAKRYGISSYSAAVIEMDGKNRVIPVAGEEKIINAILSLSSPEQKVVYFLTGHGERPLKEPSSMDGSSSELLKTALETENFAVEPLLLLTSPQVPEDAALVIASGPRKNFAPGELTALQAYLHRGGKIILAVDPGPDYGLSALLDPFDLRLGGDIIVDPVNYLMAKGPLVPIIQSYLSHPITERFTIPTVLPMTRSVAKGASDPPGTAVTILALSSDRSWAEADVPRAERGDFRYDPGQDSRGPVPVAAIVEGFEGKAKEKELTEPLQGALVVFGSSEFITNQYITLAGNREFFMNIVRYLTEDQPLIVIQKTLTASDKAPLILPPVQARMIFIGVVILQPALIMAIGIVIAWRRRQKS